MTATIDQQMDEQVGLGESKESGVSTQKELFNATVDDIATARAATIAAPALAAFTDPPNAAEMALLRTLVNEIRASLIASAGATPTLVKGA
jgi:acetylglutamate kinase